MRRALLFLALAGGGLGILVSTAGGWRGTRTSTEKPVIPVVPAPPASATGSELRVSDLPRIDGVPTRGNDFTLQPVRAAGRAFTRPRTWKDPLGGAPIELPFYPAYSVRADDLEPYKEDGPGAPSARWKGLHITVYREVEAISRDEALALQRDPESRKAIVLYEIEAEEGVANFRLEPTPEGTRPLPPRVVIRLLRGVRIHVVPDDARITTSDLVIDEGTGTVEGAGDVHVESAALEATGRGLRLDRRTGRVEVMRQVAVDVRNAADGSRNAGLDLGGGPVRPRLLRTAGTVVVARRDTRTSDAAYEVTLSDSVRLEAEDGSRLEAREVVLVLEPRGNAAPRPAAKDAAVAGAPLLAGDRGRFRLARITADGAVSAESRTREGPSHEVVRSVSLQTDRLVGRFDDDGGGTALLEGATTLRYHGDLSLPGGGARRGFVTATCRERLSYAPPAPGSDAPQGCDAVVDLVGAVRIEGSETADGERQRIEADRIRLFLRRATDAPDEKRGSPTPAARNRPEDRVAIAFVASGGDVRLSGPTVVGRAREMKAFDLDRDDAWRLVVTGPDAWVEVTEDATAPRARAKKPDAKDGASASDDGKGKKASRRERGAWAPDRLDAVGQVRGSLSPRPGDLPVSFTGDSLTYAAADGGELRGSKERPAVLTYPGERGRDQSIEAPVVGFRLGTSTASLWARDGARAVVWTGADLDRRGRPGKGRRSVALRAGSGLEASAGRTGAGERTVVVRARDGASLENRVDGAPADRVSATTISVVLVERAAPKTAEPTAAAAPTAGPASPAAGKPKADPTARRPAPVDATRWTLDCATLEVEVATGPGDRGADALRRLDATGGVRATGAGDDGGTRRFDGERLSVRSDGGLLRGRLEARPGGRALVSADQPDLPQRIASPTVEFDVSGTSLVGARFAAPVSALVHARDAKAKRTERLVLRSEAGPLTLDAVGRVVIEGSAATPVLVTRTVREDGKTEFGGSVALATPRIELTTTGGFGASRTEVERFVAEGPGTRIETGAGAGGTSTRAAGDRLVYEGRTGKLELTGRDGVLVDRPGFSGRGRRFSYDTRTGAADVEGADFVMGLPKK